MQQTDQHCAARPTFSTFTCHDRLCFQIIAALTFHIRMYKHSTKLVLTPLETLRYYWRHLLLRLHIRRSYSDDEDSVVLPPVSDLLVAGSIPSDSVIPTVVCRSLMFFLIQKVILSHLYSSYGRFYTESYPGILRHLCSSYGLSFVL